MLWYRIIKAHERKGGSYVVAPSYVFHFFTNTTQPPSFLPLLSTRPRRLSVITIATIATIPSSSFVLVINPRPFELQLCLKSLSFFWGFEVSSPGGFPIRQHLLGALEGLYVAPFWLGGLGFPIWRVPPFAELVILLGIWGFLWLFGGEAVFWGCCWVLSRPFLAILFGIIGCGSWVVWVLGI